MYLLGVILACFMTMSAPTTYAGKDDKQQEDDDVSHSLTDRCNLPAEVLMLKRNN